MAVAGMVTRLMDEPIPIRRSYIVKSYWLSSRSSSWSWSVVIMLLRSLLDCVISSSRWHVMLLTHHPSYRSYFMSTVTYVALYQAASVGSFGSIVIDTPSGWYYFMGIFLQSPQAWHRSEDWVKIVTSKYGSKREVGLIQNKYLFGLLEHQTE